MNVNQNEHICCPDASLNDENENGLWTRHTQRRAGRPVFVCPDPQGCGLYLYKSMEIRYNGYESDRKGEGCLAHWREDSRTENGPRYVSADLRRGAVRLERTGIAVGKRNEAPGLPDGREDRRTVRSACGDPGGQSAQAGG